MYVTYKQQLKFNNKYEYQVIKELCHTAKNLWNETIHYLENHKHIPRRANIFRYKLKKYNSYKKLNSQIAQNVLRNVEWAYSATIAKRINNKNSNKNNKVDNPSYLPKRGYHILELSCLKVQFSKNYIYFKLPYSKAFGKTHSAIWIKMINPVRQLAQDGKIAEIQIIPRQNARYFEVHYVCKVEESTQSYQHDHALAIDIGVNNLCTCVTSEGKSFIIDGKKLKSYIQGYCKRIAYLQNINSRAFLRKKTNKKKYHRHYTRQMYRITKKHNFRITDYITKACHIIAEYCINNRINIVIFGYSKGFKNKSKLSKQNNQIMQLIPYMKLYNKLKNFCNRYNIKFIIQEESYTSKASFLDNDYIPTFGIDKNVENTIIFSGKRIKRGLYETFSGIRLNADVNGAANILRKSKIVSLVALYTRGKLDIPKRIRVY